MLQQAVDSLIYCVALQFYSSFRWSGNSTDAKLREVEH